MSLRYGFFDSEITGFDESGMPIFDRAEDSDFFALFWARLISNGVMAAPGDCFQVIAHTGLQLKIRPGAGFIRGRFAYDDLESFIELEPAPKTYSRIDRIVLRANYKDRCCEIVKKTGVADGTPHPPELVRPASGDYYELCLATVTIRANQTVLTQASITDTRYDSSVCGVVTQLIDHLDTAVFFAQLNQFYQDFVEQSNLSYEAFKRAMEAYLNALQVSGDNQLNAIVQIMTDFEKESEKQFQAWFEHIKDQLSTDAAGHLQNQLNDHEKRITWIETALETGEVSAILATAGGEELATDAGEVFEAYWYLKER